MEAKEILKELGLSEGEAKVYLALLRLGESQVNKVKTETKIHRTTIYDFLDKLIKKGLASYVVKNNVKFFSASHPSSLDSLLKEKKEKLEETLPELVKLCSLEKKQLKVEVYEGVEGFKTLYGKILRDEKFFVKEKKELLGFGVEEAKFEEKFPYILRGYIKKEQKAGIQERLIAKKGTKFIYEYPHMHYKYIDEKFFSPTPTIIYWNSIGFIVWDPLTVIVIENKDLADAYRKHFELMWKIADKKP